MAVGFTPQNGARIKYVVPGPGTGFPPETDTFLNVNAGDPFAGLALNTDIYYARYGTPPVNAAGTEGVFPVYAEAIGSLSTAMANAAKDPANPWGLRPSGNGQATNLEVYDFAATQCPQGRKSAIFVKYGNEDGSSGVAVTPGQPAINSLTSPAPGKIMVVWQTRIGHTGFQINAEPRSDNAPSFSQRADGADRDAVIDLGGEGGEFDVTVTAFIGNTAGKPSLPKTVTVAAASSQPPVDEPPAPVDPPTPVEPPPPPPPPLDGPPAATITELSTDAQETVRLMVTWFNPAKNPGKAGRLRRLADELQQRKLVP